MLTEHTEHTAFMATAANRVAKGLQFSEKKELDDAIKEFTAAINIYERVKTEAKIVNKGLGEAYYYRAREHYDLFLQGQTIAINATHQDLDKACTLNPDSKLPYVELYYRLIKYYTQCPGLAEKIAEAGKCYSSIIALPNNKFTFKAIRQMIKFYEQLCWRSNLTSDSDSLRQQLELSWQLSNEALKRLHQSKEIVDKEVIYDIYSMTVKSAQYHTSKSEANIFILTYTAKILQTRQLSLHDMSKFGHLRDDMFLQKLNFFLKQGPGYNLLFEVIEQLSLVEAIHLLKLVLKLKHVPKLWVIDLVRASETSEYSTLTGKPCDKATYIKRIQSITGKLAILEAQLRRQPYNELQAGRLLAFLNPGNKELSNEMLAFLNPQNFDSSPHYRS